MLDALLPFDLLPSLAAAAVAATLSYLLTPLTGRLAVRLRAVDRPAGRKAHETPTPMLGGAALTLGAVVGGVSVISLGMPAWISGIPLSQVVAFAVATGLVFLTGVVDDVRGLNPGQKFLAQLGAAGTILWATGAVEQVTLPLLGSVDLGILGYLASLLWIVGITNAVNLIDGLDGLAGGIGLIIAASIAAIALLQGNQPATAVVAASLAGACLGFLPHNWTPASVFMGDSGSLTMGFILAVLTHSSSLKSSSAVAILVPILALGLPAIDTLLVMVFRFATGPQDRLTRRLGRMFKADRQHVHHLLLNIAPRRAAVVSLLYGLVGLFCLAALAASLSNNLQLGVALLILEGGVVILVRKAGLEAQARALASAQREQARQELNAVTDELRAPDLSDFEAASRRAVGQLPMAARPARRSES